MSKGRLTRQELSWLLTQEAQNAAERLRSGVQVLRTQAPPPMGVPDPAVHVETSLDALDDVMKMLSNLNQRASQPNVQAAPAVRRGRIDIASLIYEVAPDARVQLEPGSGTEVYGDEADLRRMLQVLVGAGQGGGSSGSTVAIRRDGDDVRVSVVLGPDSSPTAETERAWLHRMATRYGGRYELEGGHATISLPAEGAQDRTEREALKRELDEARAQGEVYARELAAVFDRGEEVATVSTVPPAPGAAPTERFAAIAKICVGVSAELRATLGPAIKEVLTMRHHEITNEQLDTLKRRMSRAQEVVASINNVGSVPDEELAIEVDLADVVRAAARDCGSFAERGEVSIDVTSARAYIRVGPKKVAALVRELVAHAVQASPKGSVVEVAVTDDASAVRLVVDDAGAPLPASARRGFLALETHAGAFGRPSGLPIFMAAELASCLGARMELSDVPNGKGLRVAVTFAK